MALILLKPWNKRIGELNYDTLGLPIFNSQRLALHQNESEFCQQINSGIRTSVPALHNVISRPQRPQHHTIRANNTKEGKGSNKEGLRHEKRGYCMGQINTWRSKTHKSGFI